MKVENYEQIWPFCHPCPYACQEQTQLPLFSPFLWRKQAGTTGYLRQPTSYPNTFTIQMSVVNADDKVATLEALDEENERPEKYVGIYWSWWLGHLKTPVTEFSWPNASAYGDNML